MFDDVPHRHHIEVIQLVNALDSSVPDSICNPSLLACSTAHWLGSMSPGFPSVVCRYIHKHACISAYVQQTASISLTGEFLHGSQVMFKSQNTSCAFFNIKRIFNRFVDSENVVAFRAGIGVNHTALVTAHNRSMPAVATAGTRIGVPVAVLHVVQGGRDDFC